MRSGKLFEISVLQCLFATIYSSSNFINDYCWRDYDGIMPLDAFKAGRDRLGQPIYIGQVLYENKLIPGKIHENQSTVHFEFRYARTSNESLKILCTDNPKRFKWIATTTDGAFRGLSSMNFFEGGYEKGYRTLIGRAMSYGELTIGKVVCSNIECYRLTTIENGSWTGHGSFEVLLFNPDDTPNILETVGVSFVPYLMLLLMVVSLLIAMFFILRLC